MITIGQLFGLFVLMIVFMLVASPLDRDKARRRNTFKFRDLPSGTYEIHAVLLESGGQPRPSVVGKLEVI